MPEDSLILLLSAAFAGKLQVQLSSVNKVAINMPVGGADGGGTEVVLTRGAFEKLTAPLFRRCQQPMEHACWQVLCLRPPMDGNPATKQLGVISTLVPVPVHTCPPSSSW